MEITSLIASIVSVAIGLMAIWLSIVFYKLSSQLSESTKEAAKDISASVNRLEKLFDTLYSDTFSMMKDTVSDMRKHMWPTDSETPENLSQAVEQKADERVEQLKADVEAKMSKLLHGQTSTNTRIESLAGELRALFDKAINDSRKVEAEVREETVREHIFTSLSSNAKEGKLVKADDLVDEIVSKGFPARKVVAELRKMSKERIINTDTDNVGPYTVITLKL